MVLISALSLFLSCHVCICSHSLTQKFITLKSYDQTANPRIVINNELRYTNANKTREDSFHEISYKVDRRIGALIKQNGNVYHGDICITKPSKKGGKGGPTEE